MHGIDKCTPTNVSLTIGLTILIIISDITTDLMSEYDQVWWTLISTLTFIVLSIPIIILWKASMNTKQKLGLGAFLTMNVWLVLIALVRVASFKRGNYFDLTWILFFQFFEPNVAILAACFSAFRSLFVKIGYKHRPRQGGTPYPIRRRIFRMTSTDRQEVKDLPSIPRATLASLRTIIWRNNRTNITNHGSNRDALDSATEGEIDLNDNIFEQDLDGRGNNIVVQKDWTVSSARASPLFDDEVIHLLIPSRSQRLSI